MTQNQVGTAQSQGKKRGKKQGRKGGAQEQKPRLTPEQRLERNVKRVTEEGYVPVPRRALETNAMIALVTKNDFLVDRLRDRIEADTTIDTVQAIQLLKENREIRERMNLQNAKLCAVMGWDYEPPKGFEKPMEIGQKPAHGALEAGGEPELPPVAVNE